MVKCKLETNYEDPLTNFFFIRSDKGKIVQHMFPVVLTPTVKDNMRSTLNLYRIILY